MKKHSGKVKKGKNTNLKYLFPVLVFSLVLLGVVTVVQNQHSTRVLGEQTRQKENTGNNQNSSSNREGIGVKEEAEPTEAPEPTETPEQEKEHEQEAKNVQHEVENQVQQGNVEKVEVRPSSAKPGEGTLRIEKTNGTVQEKTVPTSQTSLISIQNPEAGTVQVSVGKDGTATIVNNGITVQTNYPVVIDLNTKTVGIKTPSGVTIISTLPSQAVNNLSPSDKPTIVQSAVLGEQNGQPYYDISGVQHRKFVGLVPVNANIETRIDAQNGTVISSQKPWFLNFLGFLYSI